MCATLLALVLRYWSKAARHSTDSNISADSRMRELNPYPLNRSANTLPISRFGRSLGLAWSPGCNSERFGGEVETYKLKQMQRLAAELNTVHHRVFSVKKTNTQPANKRASANPRTRLNLARIFDSRSPSGLRRRIAKLEFKRQPARRIAYPSRIGCSGWRVQAGGIPLK